MVTLFIYVKGRSGKLIMNAEEVPKKGTSFLVSWEADPGKPTVLVEKVEPTEPGGDFYFRVLAEIVKPTKII